MAVDNCHGNRWSEKFTTTGRRRWFPAWSWTNDCTAHDQATLEPKVKVPYWHGMSELCFKQARPHKWKLETGQQDITTVTKQRRWKLLGHVSRKGRDTCSITWTALRWTPDSGRRKRGRPRETCGSMRQKWKQQGRHGKNSRRQPRIGSNGNPWSQPYVPLRREEDRASCTIACQTSVLCTSRSPSLGACKSHNKTMQRHFCRPVYF